MATQTKIQFLENVIFNELRNRGKIKKIMNDNFHSNFNTLAGVSKELANKYIDKVEEVNGSFLINLNHIKELKKIWKK